MLVVTTENVAGHRVTEMKGQCFGVVVRSRGLGGNIMAGLRSIVGGEIDEYTQLLEEARRHAIDRLVRNATAMGANAVHAVRFRRNRPDDERDRRLRHGGRHRARTGVSRSVLRAALFVASGSSWLRRGSRRSPVALWACLAPCRPGIRFIVRLIVWASPLNAGNTSR
jgi:uncharacterized protein YbjQ (UPF0145 family)